MSEFERIPLTANNFENPEVFMEVAEAAAGHYADSYAVKLLAFSENATYLVYDPATDEKLFVLRVGGNHHNGT